jgi:phosphatidylglycerophosphate synthase
VEARGISFAAVASGKVKMALQCVAIGGVLLFGLGLPFVRARLLPGPSWDGGPWTIAHLAVAAALLLTVVSGIDYLVRAVRHLSRG